MAFQSIFARQPRLVILFETLVLLGLVGFLDYHTGWEVSMSIFYGIPISLAAWFCTRKDAILVALLAGIVWWWADVQAGHPYLNNWQEGWETMVRLGFFIFIAFGSASLRAQAEAAAARIALLEQNQQLEREIVSISEREQRRIGQDLHDGLCQFLAALSCSAASLRAELDDLRLKKQAGVAGELANHLNSAVVQSRDLAHGLIPVPMEEGGLTSALDNLANSVRRLQGIECKFECASVGTVERRAATHLYRIAQEAISNATRHGQAQEIDISLGQAAGVTTLQVVDNGAGISRTSADPHGAGMRIMNYRARSIGGQLCIQERPEGGTIVSCAFPATQTVYEIPA
jgi:signal transduction histidine kinase